MTWENPQVPHEVNVSRESTLREFLRLGAGLAIFLSALGAALYVTGGWLARLVPFSTERDWVGDRIVGLELFAPAAPAHPGIEPYLQGLAAELGTRMELPPGMTVDVHYRELEVPNAFATLGGQIVVTSGLYRRMPSENALAMVLAHEIAHVRARDPISALGGSASIALLFALLSGEVDGLLPHLSRVVLSGYSRRAEARADAAAVAAIAAHYGHAGGAAAVFEVLAEYRDSASAALPSLLSTHPADSDRIARMEAAASDWDAERQPLRPIAIPDGEP
jgi:Zn-dependent protease with chaperone function